MEADLLDRICDIGSSERQVSKGTGKASVNCRVCDMLANVCSEFGAGVDWCRAWVAGCHSGSVNYVGGIVLLTEEDPSFVPVDTNSKKIVKIS